MLPAPSPSFRDSGDGSPNWISAADELEQQPSCAVDDADRSSDGEFEFALLARDSADAAIADDIFSNGRILPVYYPLFDRHLLLAGGGGELEEGKAVRRLPLHKLLIEERDGEMWSISETTSSPSSSVDDLEGIPPETFCAWEPRSVPPSPDRCKKSWSTGSASSRRWRIRDLVVGRSHSDGKEKFRFLAAAEEKGPKLSPGRDATKKGKVEAAAEGRKGKGARVSEVDMVTAHRMYYAKGGGDGSGGGWRRSFLPYKQDIVGLFGNVNGLTRAHHPF